MSTQSSNSNHNDSNADLELDRYVNALRDEPAAEGPSPEMYAKTRAMLRDASSSDETKIDVTGRRRSFLERLVPMTFAQRMAAVVMLTIGAVVLYVMFALFNTLGPSMALADVVERINAARTLTYVSTVTLNGRQIATRTLLAEPDRRRMEMPNGAATISSGRTFLVVDPRSKTATRTELATAGVVPMGGPSINVIDAMKQIGGQKGEPLGERVIGGKPAIGFKSKLGGRDMIVWADKKTSNPVRIEMPMNIAGGQETIMVMDQFVIDPPIDDSLFSLEAPAGYKLVERKMELPKVTTNLEEAATGLLRIIAENGGGAFPAALNDWAAVIEATKSADDATKQKAIGFAGSLTALTATIEWGYAGKGVKLGEKDKLIFWYRKDAKAPTYRAIFGDLRVEDVTPDKLPTTKPATP